MQRPRDARGFAGRALRRGALLGALALVAACAGPVAVRPSVEHAPSAERAQQLARAGDHAASARQWELVAAAAPAPSLEALGNATREWLLVPSVADATRVEAALAAVPGVDPRSPAGTSRALLGAEVALAAGQPDRALAALKTLGDPPPAGAEGDVLLWRGRAYLAAGRALDGIRTLGARERFVPAAEVPGTRRQLWEALRAAAAHGASVTVPKGTDVTTAGWLDLARVAT